MLINKEDVVTHKATGNKYQVVSVGLLKKRFLWFSWWVSVVVYEAVTIPNRVIFVRGMKDFETNFKKVEKQND